MQTAIPPASRSSFVDVVAWIFIVLEGFGAFVGLMQNILLNTVLPFDGIQNDMARNPLPPMFQWLFDHFRLFLLAMFVLAVVKLVAAIGLLRRLNWARLLFVAFLALAIVGSLVGIVLMQSFMDQMLMVQPKGAPPGFADQMHVMMTGMRVFAAVFILGFSVLYAWIIRRLVSPRIVAEFR